MFTWYSYGGASDADAYADVYADAADDALTRAEESRFSYQDLFLALSRSRVFSSPSGSASDPSTLTPDPR